MIDADPFAVEQGEDVLIPIDLEKALKADVKEATTRDGHRAGSLVNQSTVTLVEKVLKQDLAKNPRQGTELLQWLRQDFAS